MAENGGRPKADIDWNKVDALLIAGCSGREIAGNFGLNPHTIYDRCEKDHGVMFSEYSQQRYAKGEALLRAQQFAKALGKTTEGDNTMLVWLGKNRLGQGENYNINANVNIKTIDYSNAETDDRTDDTSQVQTPELSTQGDESSRSGDQ